MLKYLYSIKGCSKQQQQKPVGRDHVRLLTLTQHGKRSLMGGVLAPPSHDANAIDTTVHPPPEMQAQRRMNSDRIS